MRVRFRHLLVPAALATLLFAAPASAAGRPEALIARAVSADARGKFDDAVMLMQAAVVADPARAASYVALGELYARHGDPHFAHKYFDEALYLDPSLAAALAGSGKADLALGDRAAAQAKLARLQRVCGAGCKDAAALKAAIGAGKNADADAAPSSLDKP